MTTRHDYRYDYKAWLQGMTTRHGGFTLTWRWRPSEEPVLHQKYTRYGFMVWLQGMTIRYDYKAWRVPWLGAGGALRRLPCHACSSPSPYLPAWRLVSTAHIVTRRPNTLCTCRCAVVVTGVLASVNVDINRTNSHDFICWCECWYQLHTQAQPSYACLWRVSVVDCLWLRSIGTIYRNLYCWCIAYWSKSPTLLAGENNGINCTRSDKYICRCECQ